MNIIKETPLSERPREKAIKYGFSSLSNSELLAIILKTGTKNTSVISLAQTVINKCGGFENLPLAELEDLVKIKGISNVKALEILSIFEIVKRVALQSTIKIPSFNNPALVSQYFNQIFGYDNQEKFVVAFLDIKNQLIRTKTLFKGGINFSAVDTNVIFKFALKYYSTKIICLHNHPSGVTDPSPEDIRITKIIAKKGSSLGIELLDHIIIGKNNYTSLKEKNLF